MKYLKNVVTLKLYKDKCTGCAMCINVCPHGVFVMDKGKAEITDKDSCMECGACANNCAFSAISVMPGLGCAAAMIIRKIAGEGSSGDDCDCGCC